MIIICPIARAENAPRVVTQWQEQTHPCDLVFCPSPAAWPELLALDTRNAVIAHPRSTIGEARNEGLDVAARMGHGWALFWDDDNYHGPAYAREFHEAASPGVDVLSKGLAFVRHDSGLWKYRAPLTFCPGHSTGVRVGAAARFPALSLAEDVAWSRAMAGRRAGHLSPWGLVYDRRSPAGHAYDAAEAEFRAAHGAAHFIGPDVPDSIVDTPFPITSPAEGVVPEALWRALERRSPIARARCGR